MKKRLLPIFLFLTAVAFAQPILQADSFLPNGYGIYYSAPTVGYTNGTPGENLWDYSFLPLTQFATASIVPLETVPFYEEFPTANFCIKNIDQNMGTYYNLFESDSDSHRLIGYVTPGSYQNYIDDPLTVLQFPLTYNLTYTDTFESNGLGQGTFYTRTYDAYGTLVTPFGQYDNVIRQKTVSASGTRYSWFSSNPYFLIIAGNFDSPSVTFYRELSLGTTQNTKAAFSIYPNPTTADFTIGNQQDAQGFATVYDIQGKVIIAAKDLKSSNTISLKDCNDGVYFVAITDKDNRTLGVEKIIKN